MCYFTTAARTTVINWYYFPFVFSVFKMRMSKFFFQLVIVIHVFACAWYCLACPLNECYPEENWVKHQGNSCHQLQDKLDSSTRRLINFSRKKYLIFLLRKCCARGWLTSVLDRMKIADIPDSILLSFFSKYQQNNRTNSSVCLIQMNTTTALIGAMLLIFYISFAVSLMQVCWTRPPSPVTVQRFIGSWQRWLLLGMEIFMAITLMKWVRKVNNILFSEWIHLGPFASNNTLIAANSK